jgi:hypothetical protein
MRCAGGRAWVSAPPSRGAGGVRLRQRAAAHRRAQGGSLPSNCDRLPSKCDSLPSKCDSVPSECGSLVSNCDRLPSKDDSLPSKCDSLPSTRAGQWLDVWRGTLDAVNANARVEGGVTLYPQFYGAFGRGPQSHSCCGLW